MEILKIIRSIFFLCTVTSAFFLYSCNSERTITKTIFEGNWKDLNHGTLNDWELYRLNFKSDSFYLVKHQYTDVAVIGKCTPYSVWDEYYSGRFRFTEDSLYLTGVRTDSLNRKMDSSECIKNVGFHVTYKYEFRKDTLLLYPKDYLKEFAIRIGADSVRQYQKHFSIYLKRE